MEKNLFTVKFTTTTQFNTFYKTIKLKQIFLPVSIPLKETATIILKIIIPVIDHVFVIEGTVSNKSSAPGKSGIYVDISNSMESDLLQIDNILAASDLFSKQVIQEILETTDEDDNSLDMLESEIEALTDDFDMTPEEAPDDLPEVGNTENSAEQHSEWLSFDELKKLVAQEEQEIEVEIEPEEVVDEPIFEKKVLTDEERQKAEPIGKFIMNLTKAMLRSGYYDPGHPGSGSAKKGLYDEFVRVLGVHSEIMLSIEKTKDDIDIVATGVLDEPVTVRELVGPGVAELFVPKLGEYYERKELLAFAIKKEITPEHFDQFMDIMSDPKVDHSDFEKAGIYLTNALAENDITEISTVFVDDMIHLELNLPGRVEMAIQRLAKDLRVMPMFKGVDLDTVKKMKLQTVQDIIRPLNQPRYLNDFLVNCYIIADHVHDMEPEDIENIIIDAFPVQLLLPTSHYVFKEMEYLKQLRKEQESKLIDKRVSGIKRILKLISSRVLKEDAPGTQKFLTYLYTNNILGFKELPADVQYVVNTRKLADAIRHSLDDYLKTFLSVKTSDDALVYLKTFRRTAPIFIESKDWDILKIISESLTNSLISNVMNSGEAVHTIQAATSQQIANDECLINMEAADISEQLMAYVFINVMDNFVSVYESIGQDQRKIFEELIDSLGVLGVDVLCRVLINSDNKEIRKLSSESIIKKGELARRWSLNTLDDKNRAWFIHRNAMMILRNVSQNQEDFESVRSFLNHSDARLRDEALKLVVRLEPIGGEFLVINAITDEDAKVRWRASRALGELPLISDEAITEMLKDIASSVSEDKEEAKNQMQKKILLINAVSAIPNIHDAGKVEIVILETMKTVAGHGKGLMKMLKRVAGLEEEAGVLKAGIVLLGIVGSEASEGFLNKLSRSHSHLSKAIKNTLARINKPKK